MLIKYSRYVIIRFVISKLTHHTLCYSRLYNHQMWRSTKWYDPLSRVKSTLQLRPQLYGQWKLLAVFILPEIQQNMGKNNAFPVNMINFNKTHTNPIHNLYLLPCMRKITRRMMLYKSPTRCVYAIYAPSWAQGSKLTSRGRVNSSQIRVPRWIVVNVSFLVCCASAKPPTLT